MASTPSDLITQYWNTDRPGTTGISRVNLNGARKRHKIARFTIDISEDGAGHIYRCFRVKAHDVPVALFISNDGAATGVNDMNIGVRTPADSAAADNDPAQISAAADSCLSDAYDMSSAAATPTNIFGAGASAPSLETELGDAFWQLADVATEPAHGTEYEVVVISVGDPATADENVAIMLEYVAGD